MSEELHMWSYWRDKRGSAKEALEADYPELVKTNLLLPVALLQIQSAEALIDKIMSEMEADDDDENI
ncbi:MAG: hypothetical protein IIA49_10490 [Bacteroidetes bacterium]|nr:hypothetical protein [Bacteroidota bacterium]